MTHHHHPHHYGVVLFRIDGKNQWTIYIDLGEDDGYQEYVLELADDLTATILKNFGQQRLCLIGLTIACQKEDVKSLTTAQVLSTVPPKSAAEQVFQEEVLKYKIVPIESRTIPAEVITHCAIFTMGEPASFPRDFPMEEIDRFYNYFMKVQRQFRRLPM
jgi:hypothetical protein